MYSSHLLFSPERMPYSLDPQRSRYIRDSSLVDASADPWASTQRAKMSLTGEFLGPHEKLSVRLGDIIFQREPTIGKPSRWTTILEAQCKKFPDEALIVKIDHVPMTRYPEALTVQKLRAKAVSHEKHNWTLNHLPDLRGFKMKPGPPQDNSVGFRLSQLLREGNPSLRWENPKNPFYYERRTFDRLLQGRLQPLLTLEDQKDTGQVLFDVLQSVFSFPLVVRVADGDLFLLYFLRSDSTSLGSHGMQDFAPKPLHNQYYVPDRHDRWQSQDLWGLERLGPVGPYPRSRCAL